MDYLVSVVVPTKNRYIYLKELIKLIDKFKLPELELVVQDNSDDNAEILDYLKGFDNPCIKYFYSSDKLTMSGNAERGIMNASGEYVCYIGDDDGVCRNIVSCVRWMKEKGLKVAVSGAAWFVWGGKIRIYHAKSRKIKILNSEKKRKGLARKGMVLDKTMPNIYQSIVERQLLIDLYKKHGTLFPSVPPDIAGSLVMSYAVKEYASFNFPVVIIGSSAMTGGGVVKRGGVLPLEDVPFISQKDIEIWDKRVPPLWCGNYAWLNSAIKTLELLNHQELIKEIDFEYGLAGAIVHRPKKKELWRLSFKFARRKVYFCLILALRFINYWIEKISFNIGFNTKNSFGKKDIIEAETFFIENYNGPSFQ